VYPSQPTVALPEIVVGSNGTTTPPQSELIVSHFEEFDQYKKIEILQ